MKELQILKKAEIEKSAIIKVEKARELIIKSIPKRELVSIYIKGSFARREMKSGSDVDMVPIVTENKYEGPVFEVNNPSIEPVCVVPLSLWELRNNQLFTNSDHIPDLRAKPDRFLKKINEFKLIYGQALDPSKFLIRNDKEALIEEIEIIKNGYILNYESGLIDFKALLKEVFWLVEMEQNYKGNNVEHSFKGIAEVVKDEKHIINYAYQFRIGQIRGKNEEQNFIRQLRKFLMELERSIK
ncbi:hypothetical protein J4467_02900 [Candidatus Woesearchaeota archaeon]|nr:hypothetical protein [Candidatus Woesearchaeota archaeon]